MTAHRFEPIVCVSRVPHFCWGCGRRMPPGSTLSRVAEVDAAEWFHTYWCPVCAAYWADRMSNDDTIEMGGLCGGDPCGWEDLRQEIEA